jgi:hypothetical protein
LWGESVNEAFVGVASLYAYATQRAGWYGISSFFWIGLPLNALAYGLMLATAHRCLRNALGPRGGASATPERPSPQTDGAG